MAGTRSLIKCLRDVSILIGYQWHKYQDYLIEQGKQKDAWLDYDSYFRQMSYSWYLWYGSYELQITTPDIDLSKHGLKGYFSMSVSLSNGKDPYIYVWGRSRISDQDINEIERQINHFFPGIERGSHFEPCHWCEEFRLCDRLEDLWICSSCLASHEKDQKDTEGYVYVFGSEAAHYYKIGASKIPENRLVYYGDRFPFDIKMLHLITVDDKYEAESQLHAKFSNKRKKREWFKLDSDDFEFIKSLQKYQDGKWTTVSGETIQLKQDDPFSRILEA